ncbi:UxaA family hydrolase [Roseinatronobacter alkalisoli]|uniref:Altronate dehydratase family protein n=1 Tax=Roseinatronobacter alkalisoli TaxID=3028235 RepID=A0ABT5TAT5_9RHOB|nr:altronate dehydratase family protein [Roseinatronobacter sp. HJB301]MDD7972233.1 altronate dehydratase family protein [Roseinatronobacter sp. HJB301]
MSEPLILNPADTVAILTEKGVASAGHKVARQPMPKGAPVIKCGQVIGYATTDIEQGAHVHSHNCAFGAHGRDYSPGAGLEVARAALEIHASAPAMQFQGYHRDGGQVGTRNYIALVATVNCSATVIRRAADELDREGALDAYANVDGVAAFAHGTGCGMGSSGPGYDALKRVLTGYAGHANVGAALFVGLGCEVMQIARMKQDLGAAARFHWLTIQDTGGTRATIDAIKARVREILPAVNAARRTPAPVSALKIGLQCGGSDGFSAITANPALGVASDMLAAQGASVVLSETPEIFGAERLLLDRAVSEDVARKLMARISWWEDYTARNGVSLDSNPSPGNKAGGLTTILEKSLGAVAKAGSTPLQAVLDYAEPITAPGLNFMDTPGYDPVSATGQIAGGAQLIVFTTGRGSAFGSKPAPTLKLATNSRLFDAMRDDMDLNCGDILDGVSLQDKAAQIVQMVLATASGQVTKSEGLGLGDHEFVPWQIGAVV